MLISISLEEAKIIEKALYEYYPKIKGRDFDLFKIYVGIILKFCNEIDYYEED